MSNTVKTKSFGLRFCLLSLAHGLPSGKESSGNLGDVNLCPGSGRSPGEENGNPFQCSCLKNLMDRGAWQDAVHGITRVRLSD